MRGKNSQTNLPVAAGADVVKGYADYPTGGGEMRFPPALKTSGPDQEFPPLARNPDYLLFSQEEMDALVEEAYRAECPVAAHCSSTAAIEVAARAGLAGYRAREPRRGEFVGAYEGARVRFLGSDTGRCLSWFGRATSFGGNPSHDEAGLGGGVEASVRRRYGVVCSWG